MFARNSLRDALDLVGVLLADRGHHHEIVTIGGGSLLLTNTIQRPTKDLDALAVVVDGVYRTADPLPESLRTAVMEAADVLGLARDWLNPGPTRQLESGLPEGFAERTETHVFGGLTLQLAGRFDQICLKLYAAADDGPAGKHFADLTQLAPDDDELGRASPWVKDQDLSPEFKSFVDQIVARLEAVRGAP